MPLEMPECETDVVSLVSMESGVSAEGIVTNIKIRSRSGSESWAKIEGLYSIDDFNGAARTFYWGSRLVGIEMIPKQVGQMYLHKPVLKFWR